MFQSQKREIHMAEAPQGGMQKSREALTLQPPIETFSIVHVKEKRYVGGLYT